MNDFRDKIKAKLKRIDSVDGQNFKIEKRTSENLTTVTYTQKVESWKQYKVMVFEILHLDSDSNFKIKLETKVVNWAGIRSTESYSEFDTNAIKNDPLENLNDLLLMLEDIGDWAQGVKKRSASIASALSVVNLS